MSQEHKWEVSKFEHSNCAKRTWLAVSWQSVKTEIRRIFSLSLIILHSLLHFPPSIIFHFRTSRNHTYNSAPSLSPSPPPTYLHSAATLLQPFRRPSFAISVSRYSSQPSDRFLFHIFTTIPCHSQNDFPMASVSTTISWIRVDDPGHDFTMKATIFWRY